MKKIFTLMLASLFSVALFAADRRPSVTIQSSRNYEIVIDGKSYFSNINGFMNLGNMRDGRHTITVYKVKDQGLFRKSRKMVSASAFTVRHNDIKILVDFFGKIQVTESRSRNDRGGWDQNGRYDNDHDMERQDRNGRGGRF